MRGVFRNILVLCLSGLLAACGVTPDRLVVERTEYSALDGWEQDDHEAALHAFLFSCEDFRRRDDAAIIGKAELASPAHIWKRVCLRASDAMLNSGHAARDFFEAEFTPFEASNRGNRTGLFTGYYEPLLHGSKTRHGVYQTPLYRLPLDRVEGVPYFTREEIERGALEKRGLELLWVNDVVDLFFLQIQGSGRVKLDDGSVMRIAYAGQNGYSYVGIGKLMKERGLLDNVSMHSIKEWLRANPAEGQKLMWENASYIFFKQGDDTKTVGAQNVPLTAERSVAVDKRFIPYGMPLYVNTTLAGDVPYQRLMIAQDTGGAIKGPVRADIFFGFGGQAEQFAGTMKGRGGWTLLVPNAIAAGIDAQK